MTVVEADTSAGGVDRRRADASAWLESNRAPVRADEAWRYAPLDRLEKIAFSDPEEAPDATIEMPEGLVGDYSPHRIVFVNGRVHATSSSIAELAGVAVGPLHELGAAAALPAVDDRSYRHSYDALIDAHALDGVLCEIAENTDIAEPIHIVHLLAPTSDDAGVCTEVIVRAGAGATVTIIESRVGLGDRAGATNVRTRIETGESASVQHVVVQDGPPAQHHLHAVEAKLGVDSSLSSFVANLGCSTSRAEMIIELATRSSVDLAGIAIGRDEQVHDHQIVIHHIGQDAESSQDFRTVLDDRSRGVFSGSINVAPGADGTQSSQSNHNLLLSDQAEADTQPRLEILADDVACSHGATVGQLDDDAMFYLRSRGIPRDEAQRVLIDGFAHHNTQRIPSKPVKDFVDERISERQR